MIATVQPEGASRPVLWRAMVGLLVPPLSLAVVFGAFGAYFALRYGLRGEAVGKAIEPFAVVPVLLNLTVIFVVTRLLMHRDGYSLASIGWVLRPPKLVREVLIGLAAGAMMGLLDQFAFFPLIRAVPNKALTPFDPTIPTLSVGGLLLVQVVGAFVEETLYRGYCLMQVRRRLGVRRQSL
jgi:membrane protease YdiL (CAAX protease family)